MAYILNANALLDRVCAYLPVASMCSRCGCDCTEHTPLSCVVSTNMLDLILLLALRSHPLNFESSAPEYRMCGVCGLKETIHISYSCAVHECAATTPVGVICQRLIRLSD
jgi:hypothetical protein